MGWLMDFLSVLESDPEIRRQLRLFANPLALTQGGWICLTEGSWGTGGAAGRRVAVRAAAPARRALSLARTPMAYSALAADLLERPGATPGDVDFLIDELWRQSFLLTDLRPPLTGPAPARYVLDRLAGLVGVERVRSGLAALLDALDRWDTLAYEERCAGWADVTERASRLHRPSPSGRRATVQVDTALVLDGRRIRSDVAKDAATAAELLLRMSPYPDGMPHLQAYRERFEARYGTHAEVPLLELTDSEWGLGPLDQGDLSRRPRPAAGDVARRRALHEVALGALRDGRTTVELDAELLGRLETPVPAPDRWPPSLDVCVLVAARSRAAIDAGDYTVIVSPGHGVVGAGRAIGRFDELLGADDREARATAERDQEGYTRAELVYLPEHARAANVAVHQAPCGRVIVCGTTPGVDWDRVIPLNELLVGLVGGRFCVRWAATGSEIIVYERHLLTPRLAPPALSFLQEVESDRHVAFLPFDWGPAAQFPFLPRVQHGRIVLAPCRWCIGEASPLRTSPSAFPDALARWRERWQVPAHVYLADGDQRLLLDLADADHADLLRDTLTRTSERPVVTLEEALPDTSDAWLPGPGGGHVAELVVPLRLGARREGTERHLETAPWAPPPAAEVRLRPPGSDWLYLKLYCPAALQDAIIDEEVGPFAAFAESAGLADEWFFVRYRDPDPHLRVRFRGDPDRVMDLLPKACDMAAGLVADGVCWRFALDTYEREVERYGGEAGIGLAERLFAVDSRTVVMLLRLEPTLSTIDRTALTVLSMDTLLEGLRVDPAGRAALYGTVRLSRSDGRDYRRRRDLLRQLLAHGPEAQPGGVGLADVLERRRRALEAVAERLHRLRHEGALHRDHSSLISSYAHMHCNRMLGTGAAREIRVHQLARRAHDSLGRASMRGLDPRGAT